MPIYQFAHPEHPIVIDVVQSMKEPHVYIDEDGIEWNRVWSCPNTSIDTQIDPFSKEEFVNKTAKEGMTAGEMMDLSKELSNKRKRIAGQDLQEKKYFKKEKKNFKKKKR